MSGWLARWRYRRLLARMAGPQLLSAFADAYPRAVFVEIGANDGRDFDHLHELIRERRWRGVLVEPVPYIFERLQATYAGVDHVALENAAIADREGSLEFFHMREVAGAERDALPDYYDALGSFSLDAIRAHAPEIPDLEARIVRTEVRALTFAGLLERHELEGVDLVAIDTEGHDYQIVKSIDFDHHAPRLLIYEHFHLSETDRSACVELLRGAGYATLEEGFDTFCLRRVDDALSETFSKLRPAVPAVFKP